MRLVRANDPETSHAAAANILPKLNALQSLVLKAYVDYGAMSAREAERLLMFAKYAPSTVRKRISELHRMGALAEVGWESRLGNTHATVYEAHHDLPRE